jgi:hypothetical protein
VYKIIDKIEFMIIGGRVVGEIEKITDKQIIVKRDALTFRIGEYNIIRKIDN